MIRLEYIFTGKVNLIKILGLARFATEPYEAPNRDNLDNICMHLTNYAINKDSDNFIFNRDAKNMNIGHKRSLTSVFEYLRSKVKHIYIKGADINSLWRSIKNIMIKTLCTV